MLFNSTHFVFFLPAVVILYFSLSSHYRWIMLLGASYYFYMCWNPMYLGLIVITTLVAYATAFGMGKERSGTCRKAWLTISLVVNLGILFFFKYFNFFSHSLTVLLHDMGSNWQSPSLSVLLPVGISFYTFQTLSYSIDVYRGERDPERHVGIFALYVAFFPQLVAGPIERSTHLLPQFRVQHAFERSRFVLGLQQILWGYFLKLVLADRLALYVDAVYGNCEFHNGLTLLLATVFFAFQIYGDFAGYSLIAIGSANLMGYELMQNFRRPYFSLSISEFWKRWHISLSTWFRDYVYIPLGGNRHGPLRRGLNIMIVFLVSGLWHGAGWTFVFWGGLHGIYLLCEAVFGMSTRPDRQWLRVVRRLWIFLLVTLAWVFFRAPGLHEALLICTRIFSRWSKPFLGDSSIVVYGLAAVGLLLGSEICAESLGHPLIFGNSRRWVRWFGYLSICVIILLFGVLDGGQFIYFQF